jgi:predicted CoA-substrate-specific enzyme activase
LRDAFNKDRDADAAVKRLGIDVGSRFVKFAVFEDDALLSIGKLDTISFYRDCRLPTGGLDMGRLEFITSPPDSFDQIISTGYGRYNVNIEGAKTISEIQAHMAGVLYQTGLADFTLLDIGGQDTKVARVRDGELDDFMMNDKCAAGSGRYLENIANSLGITADEMAAHHEDPAQLSATCAIFGESEVIGHLAEGTPIEKICAGANLSVARRLLTLALRYSSPTFVVTGGVAKNRAVVRFIAERCGGEVIVPERPIHNGAIGCAALCAEPTTAKPIIPDVGAGFKPARKNTAKYANDAK